MTCHARVKIPGVGWRPCHRRWCWFGLHETKATAYITVRWPRKPFNHPRNNQEKP